jgi:hypothetical protein
MPSQRSAVLEHAFTERYLEILEIIEKRTPHDLSLAFIWTRTFLQQLRFILDNVTSRRIIGLRHRGMEHTGKD